tara:strand:- start:3764 stop:3910 length:147 start_codon:yes stop_codon:yes gene_type:complete
VVWHNKSAKLSRKILTAAVLAGLTTNYQVGWVAAEKAQPPKAAEAAAN